MGWESFGVVGFDLGPCLQGQTRIAKLITRLLMVLEVWDGKPTYRKSWAGILLVWSDLTFGPLLLGQMRTAKLKSAYSSLIIVSRRLIGPVREIMKCPVSVRASVRHVFTKAFLSLKIL